MGFIPVHFAWSRDLYQSATVTFTVNEAKHIPYMRETMQMALARSGQPSGRLRRLRPSDRQHRHRYE